MFSKASATLLLMLLGVSALLLAGAEGGKDRHKDPRVFDAKPSDAEHEDDDDDETESGGDDHHDDDKHGDEGDDDDHHDSKYDHESFLGREESHKFDEMSPEESKEKLTALIGKIDTNNDTKVSPEEMQAWLAAVAKGERTRAAESRFHNLKATVNAKDLDSPLTLEEYKQAIHHEIIGDEPTDKSAQETYNTQMVRDQARWLKADADGDKLLNKTEFADFLHPEEAPSMKDIVIQETMMNTDKNKDGKIDLNEFMKDLHPEYENDVKNKKKLPDWVEAEEKQFKEKLDINKDGSLDPNEVYKWIVPDDFDHSHRETKHLFKITDENKDNALTKDEILKKWETFVGHQATNYGNFGSHDEL
ncbi:hypothetical protein BOX15_Mlig012182g1 [Macrostomum lignano]|nr:hypothetical protein BOX15_Mlig012182g1 [Macrostomum lignano]